MSKRQRSFAVISVLLFMLAFQACNKTPVVSPPANTTAMQIQLTVGPNNACLQNGFMGGKAAIGTDGVTWSGPSATSTISVTLSACPFATCSFSSPSGGGSTSSGSASGSSGTTYTYSSITIGSSQCTLNGDGLVMR